VLFWCILTLKQHISKKHKPFGRQKLQAVWFQRDTGIHINNISVLRQIQEMCDSFNNIHTQLSSDLLEGLNIWDTNCTLTTHLQHYLMIYILRAYITKGWVDRKVMPKSFGQKTKL
jgi:hypothetical protein